MSKELNGTRKVKAKGQKHSTIKKIEIIFQLKLEFSSVIKMVSYW